MNKYSKYWMATLLIVLMSITLVSSAFAIEVYVKADASYGGNGTSWSDAKNSIQDAIDIVSGSSDVEKIVKVAQGTYNECVNVPTTVKLYGGYEGINDTRDWSIFTTTLDGADLNDSVVTLNAGISNAVTTLEGFVITNGEGKCENNEIRGCGIYSTGNFILIKNNIIKNSDTLNNDFYSNGSKPGGGIYCSSCDTSTKIVNNIIHHNKTNASGKGGGIYLKNASPDIINNTICENYADICGGICVDQYSNPRIISNIIWNNSSNVGYFGGAISCDGITISLDYVNNNCIQENSTNLFQKQYTNITTVSIENNTNLIGNTNPGFYTDSLREYQLDESSICIDTGNNSYYPYVTDKEIDCQDRINNNVIDIGADEYYDITVATPTFSRSSGTYDNIITDLAINCSTYGSEIHYTLNGYTPTLQDPIYTPGQPLTINQNTTVTAKAWRRGWKTSSVASATYAFKVATPSFSPDGGLFNEPPVSVSIDLFDLTQQAIPLLNPGFYNQICCFV